MKEEDFLREIKGEYRKTNATWHLKMSGWSDVAAKIGMPEPFYKKMFYSSFIRISFATIIIFILFFGAYRVALAALPGTLFYPAKLFSEKIVETFTGDYQYAIDNRADEIIALSKKSGINTQQLKEVVIEYKEKVEEAQKQIQNTGIEDIEFKKKLENQHTQFDKIGHDNPQIEEDIKDAQDVSNHQENREED